MSNACDLKIRMNNGPARKIQKKVAPVSKPDVPPPEGAIEYLFKDYSGEQFQTELINPDIPVGREKW